MKNRKFLTRLSPLMTLCVLAILPMGGYTVSAQTPPTGKPAVPPKVEPTVPKAAQFPFTVNYRPWKGLMLVDAISTGNTPAQFVIATGLNVNTVTPDDAARLQMTIQETKVRVTALDNVTEAKQGQIKAITFGLHKEENIPAAIVDVAALLSRFPQPDAPAGWLGAPFLSAFNVTLDFRNHAVIFDKPTAPFPKEVGILVPIKVKEGRIYAKISIPGTKPFEALIDTGAVGTLIPTEIATKLKLKATDTIAIVRPDGKPGKIARALVPKFSLGKLEMRGIHVAYYPADAPGSDPNFAVIGLDILRRYRVTISYSKQQMFFGPLISANPTEDPLNP